MYQKREGELSKGPTQTAFKCTVIICSFLVAELSVKSNRQVSDLNKAGKYKLTLCAFPPHYSLLHCPSELTVSSHPVLYLTHNLRLQLDTHFP